MKPGYEIFTVKFNRLQTDKDILWTVYAIDMPYTFGNVMAIPKKIEKIKDRIKVTFKDGVVHEFAYKQDETELFYRPIKKEDVRGNESTDNEGGA